MNDTSIVTRALLVSPSFGAWTGQREDKQVTKEVHQRHNVDSKAGRYVKRLLVSDELDKVLAHQAATRALIKQRTLPWSDGTRILPTADYMDFASVMRQRKVEYEGLLDTFFAAYPDRVQEAKAALNGMWKAEDYPTVERLTHRFYWRLDFSPIPLSDDVRVHLADDQLDEVRKSVEDGVNARLRDAMRDCWARLQKAVEHIHERLSDPSNIFRDSLIEGASDLCQSLARLNIMGDADFDRCRREVESRLLTYTPQSLRDDETTRGRVAKEAVDILSRMAGYATT